MEEVDTPRVRTLFGQMLDPDPTKLHIAEFCIIECTNILWKRVRFSKMPVNTARRAVQSLISTPVIVHQATDFLPRALEIGVSNQLPIYHSIILPLAEKLRCPLITLDDQQKKVARAVGITLWPITDYP